MAGEQQAGGPHPVSGAGHPAPLQGERSYQGPSLLQPRAGLQRGPVPQGP